VNFLGERRSNQTHQSTTDPDSRLFKKAKGDEAKLAYLGEHDGQGGRAWACPLPFVLQRRVRQRRQHDVAIPSQIAAARNDRARVRPSATDTSVRLPTVDAPT
jgi:hypothetical protein